jgi:hypothetical protein
MTDTGTGAAGLDPDRIGRDVAISVIGSRGFSQAYVAQGPSYLAVTVGTKAARAMLSAVLSARPDVAGVVKRLREPGRRYYDGIDYQEAARPNRDGDAAADAITALAVQCAALREERDRLASEKTVVWGIQKITSEWREAADERATAAEAALATERERVAKMTSLVRAYQQYLRSRFPDEEAPEHIGPAVREVDPLYLAPPSPSDARAAALEEMNRAFASRRGLSLSFDGRIYAEDDNPDLWTVYQERGGINDREVRVVARANTPLEAMEAAIRALGGKDNG